MSTFLLMRASALHGYGVPGSLKGVWFAKKGKFWYWVRDPRKADKFEGVHDERAVQAGIDLGKSTNCITGLVEINEQLAARYGMEL